MLKVAVQLLQLVTRGSRIFLRVSQLLINKTVHDENRSRHLKQYGLVETDMKRIVHYLISRISKRFIRFCYLLEKDDDNSDNCEDLSLN